MKKLLKIENLVIIGYVFLILAIVAVFYLFDIKEKYAVPVFIGVFGVLPFILFFRSALKISPYFSKLFLAINAVLVLTLFIPQNKISFCFPIPLLIIFLFIIKRERRIGLEKWLKEHKYSPVYDVPKEILDALGREKNWNCFANSFFLKNEKEVPFLIWFGYTKTNVTTYINNSPVQTTALIPYTAFSFFPQTVSEKFKQNLEEMNLENNSFLENLKPSTQEKNPYLTKVLIDGTFICAWQTLHVASVLDEKTAEIKTYLEDS